MVSRSDNFTEKAQEAVLHAQELVRGGGHPQMETLHLLLALVEQPDGVVRRVLERLGATVPAVRGRLRAELERLPRQQGAAAGEGLRASTELRAAVETAQEEAGRLRDDFVSTEHLLLGVLAAGGRAAELLREAGATRDAVYAALQEVRGGQRVTDPNPESKYEALERYGRDLTKLAASGKLDPVIGRDDEIRRVVQVLSRRTKNNPVLIGDPGVG